MGVEEERLVSAPPPSHMNLGHSAWVHTWALTLRSWEGEQQQRSKGPHKLSQMYPPMCPGPGKWAYESPGRCWRWATMEEKREVNSSGSTQQSESWGWGGCIKGLWRYSLHGWGRVWWKNWRRCLEKRHPGKVEEAEGHGRVRCRDQMLNLLHIEWDCDLLEGLECRVRNLRWHWVGAMETVVEVIIHLPIYLPSLLPSLFHPSNHISLLGLQ